VEGKGYRSKEKKKVEDRGHTFSSSSENWNEY
jgi:hypothetical protein